jgi:ABC-2 type transport system permease protein
MTSPILASEVAARRAPGLGGFNLTVLKLEIRRLTRNPRTVIISIVLPAVFFLIFGLNQGYDTQRPTPTAHGNVAAFVMISLALYGGVLATTFGGAMVSIERAQGWSRQLRLTPLAPMAYILIKILTALVLGACSVAGVYIIGAATNKASMSVGLWIATGFSVWIGSLLFAAFGLFLGYLLPAENVMQLIGLILALLSFAGGVFIPVSQFAVGVRDVAAWTPLYGLNQLVHTPILGNGVDWTWVVNVLAWLIIFAGGAIWRFRRDTARV